MNTVSNETKEKAVFKRLNELEMEITSLQNDAADFATALVAVTSPEYPEADDGSIEEKFSPACELSGRILGSTKNVTLVRNHIKSLIHRLEV